MPERITKTRLQARIDGLNNRLKFRGSKYRYVASRRYDYTAIDRVLASDRHSRIGDAIAAGSKGHCAEMIAAMIVALDDASAR